MITILINQDHGADHQAGVGQVPWCPRSPTQLGAAGNRGSSKDPKQVFWFQQCSVLHRFSHFQIFSPHLWSSPFERWGSEESSEQEQGCQACWRRLRSPPRRPPRHLCLGRSQTTWKHGKSVDRTILVPLGRFPLNFKVKFLNKRKTPRGLNISDLVSLTKFVVKVELIFEQLKLRLEKLDTIPKVIICSESAYPK